MSGRPRYGRVPRTVIVSLGALALIALSLDPQFFLARGQGKGKYPAKPVRILIPSAPGGTNDQVARMVLPLFGKHVGGSALIENVPGAGGVICYNKFPKERPDGYTLLSFNFISPVVYEITRKTEYVTREYTPVACWNVKNFMLGVHVDAWKDFSEFLNAARQKKISMAVTGGATDIQMYTLEDALGIKFNMIRYESGSECSVAVAGKHVDAVLTFSFQLMPLVRAGKIRPLAVFSPKADPSLPTVPTIGGLGYGNVPCLPATNGFAAPPRTPEEIVNLLQKAVKNMTEDPECGVVAQKLGVDLDFQPPAEVAKMITQYYGLIEKYKHLIK